MQALDVVVMQRLVGFLDTNSTLSLAATSKRMRELVFRVWKPRKLSAWHWNHTAAVKWAARTWGKDSPRVGFILVKKDRQVVLPLQTYTLWGG